MKTLDFKSKKEVRDFVWKKLEKICFPQPYGRIPNFYGARKACERIRDLSEYKRAGIIFSAPDGVLLRLREITLEDGKLLLVALPKMKDFRLVSENVRPTIRAMERVGKKVDFTVLKGSVSVFAQGCVAVDLKGNRIGKGSGYGDREYEILASRGLFSPNPLYVVVAHDLQVFDDLSHLAEEHDVRADVILTPTRTIRTENYRDL
jgi:5-formyltetrahydrofolate cyclo-ligase